MKIMFEDLTYEAQLMLLNEADVSSPKEMKWHILPVAVVEFEKNEHTLSEENIVNDIYDDDNNGHLN